MDFMPSLQIYPQSKARRPTEVNACIAKSNSECLVGSIIALTVDVRYVAVVQHHCKHLSFLTTLLAIKVADML
jgi:hypothetical protein